MRRLTLILSDLYLPGEVGPKEARRELPVMRELPALEWLLRFSDSPEDIGDWRRWLLAHRPVDGRQLESKWLATPVALAARLDHVRLLDRGLLHLDESERADCREEFARVFGPQYLLHECGERAFSLSGIAAAAMPIADPARLIGTEIGPALPPREATELRRLWAEIEMWLHGAAFNASRERAVKPRVSALWLWSANFPRSSAPRADPRVTAAYFGRDPLVEALAGEGGNPAQDAPGLWTQVGSGAPQVVVEFAALTGAPHESLEMLDANWFAPLIAALKSGEIREIELLANDRRFRIGVRSHYRFWRRRRPWLARLGA
jgi:hypothetical protein